MRLCSNIPCLLDLVGTLGLLETALANEKYGECLSYLMGSALSLPVSKYLPIGLAEIAGIVKIFTHLDEAIKGPVDVRICCQ